MKHRPNYHFMPVKNWMNDPNAPIYFEGQMHLFYQHNPTDWHWGNLHWGHAVSKDLLHWEHLPLALFPAHDRGEEHCFSGCGYVNDGKIEIMYTSIGPERTKEDNAEQWIATTEDMITWTQIKENPILTCNDHPGIRMTDYRDPFVFEYRGEKFLVIAGVMDERYGAIHIYKTKDMRHWEYLNDFFRNDTSTVFECPNIAVFGDKLVLFRSIWHRRNVRYYVGTMTDDYRLNVLSSGDVDFGEFFASNISYDDQNRCILWGWCRENIRNGLLTDGEWAGVQAIPKQLTLDENNVLHMVPIPAFNNLRYETEEKTFCSFSGHEYFLTQSTNCEIVADIKADQNFCFRFLDSKDGEYTEVEFDPLSGTFKANLEYSTTLDVDKKYIPGKYMPTSDGMNHIRILIDNSLVEVFVNETSCMTIRTYPVKEGNALSIISRLGTVSGTVQVHKIKL